MGTIRASGISAPIKVDLDTKEERNGTTLITFSTSIRVEKFFILGTFLIFFLGSVLDNQPWYTFLALPALFLIVYGWFHWVYRAQEKSLMESVVEELDLEKVERQTS